LFIPELDTIINSNKNSAADEKDERIKLIPNSVMCNASYLDYYFYSSMVASTGTRVVD